MSEQFLKNGFTSPVQLLSNSTRELLLRHWRFGKLRAIKPFKSLATVDPLIWDVASTPETQSILRAILNEDIVLWGACILERPEGYVHPWHTDMESHDPSGGFASLWIALQNTARGSSLKFVPGSHLFGHTVQESRSLRQLARDAATDQDILMMAKEFNPNATIEQPECQDGDGIIFDGRIWHGSDNAANRGLRTGLLLQYAKASRPVRAVDMTSLDWPICYSAIAMPVIPLGGTPDFKANQLISPPVEAQAVVGFHGRQLALPLAQSQEGWLAHPILKGSTPNLRAIACHASGLKSGKSPHPPHRHLEEELLIILDGEAELLLPEMDGDGAATEVTRRERLAAGGFAYYPAYQWHTLTNCGRGPLSYLMLKWSGEPTGLDGLLELSVHGGTTASDNGKPFKADFGFEGPTNFLSRLHSHTTTLAPNAGYSMHNDSHDVVILVFSGRIAVNSMEFGVGGFVFCPGQVPHDMRNVSDELAQYLVFEFHGVVRPQAKTPTIKRISEPKRSLRIGFLSDHHYLPDRTGGREISTHELAMACVRAGHSPSLVVKKTPPGKGVGWIRRLRWIPSYKIDRVDDVEKRALELLREGIFDFLVIDVDRIRTLLPKKPELAARCFVFLRDALDSDNWRPELIQHGAKFLANSNFIAELFQSRTGLRPLVVPPPVQRDRYACKTNRKFVTFINPVPVKGLDLVLELAAVCPEIPFQIVESWPLAQDQLGMLKKKISSLPNVDFRRWDPDMRRIYRNTGVLIAPSRWLEGFGRVAVEAQMSGIPVIATRIGGLPEAVGDGGLLLELEAGVAHWAKALRSIWHNDSEWQNLSRAALAHSKIHENRARKGIEELLRSFEFTARSDLQASPDR